MDFKTQQREAIGRQADALAGQLQAIERELERVRCLDPDYAAYVERCKARRQYPKLALRTFWFHLDAMNRIEAGEPADPDEAKAYWSKVRKDYVQHASAVLLR